MSAPDKCPTCGSDEAIMHWRDEVLIELAETMEQIGCQHGHSHDKTPPMMYREWLLCCVAQAKREAVAPLAEEVEALRKALVSAKCDVQALKGGDSPLWTYADLDDIPDDHSDIMDPPTYTAVFAADELDKIEARIDAALSRPGAGKEK